MTVWFIRAAPSFRASVSRGTMSRWCSRPFRIKWPKNSINTHKRRQPLFLIAKTAKIKTKATSKMLISWHRYKTTTNQLVKNNKKSRQPRTRVLHITKARSLTPTKQHLRAFPSKSIISSLRTSRPRTYKPWSRCPSLNLSCQNYWIISQERVRWLERALIKQTNLAVGEEWFRYKILPLKFIMSIGNEDFTYILKEIDIE